MNLKKNIAISESGFLFNPNTGDSFSVNPIGVKIIDLLNDGLDDENIITEIYSSYEIDKDSAERDLQEFIQKLMEFNLLTQ